MKDIQIGIACGDNCEHYVNFLLWSIANTISDLDRVEILLGINKVSVNRNLLMKHSDKFDIRILEAMDGETGSKAHGNTLDVIFSDMNVKYGMFIDCDVAMLEKDWDLKMSSMIDDKNVVVGAEYDGDKYMNFPNIVGCLFDIGVFKKHNMSFKPTEYIIINEETKEIYNRNVGDRIFLDVGWQMCYKMRSNGYDGIAFPLVRTNNGSGKVKSELDAKFIKSDMRGEEHQYNGTPFFTHVGRSSTRNFLEDPIIRRWVKEVEDWIDEK